MLRSLPDHLGAHVARIRQLCRLAVAENFVAISSDAETVGTVLAMTPGNARTGPLQLLVNRGRGELQEIPLSSVAAVDTIDRVVVLSVSSGSIGGPARATERLRLVVDQ